MARTARNEVIHVVNQTSTPQASEIEKMAERAVVVAENVGGDRCGTICPLGGVNAWS